MLLGIELIFDDVDAQRLPMVIDDRPIGLNAGAVRDLIAAMAAVECRGRKRWRRGARVSGPRRPTERSRTGRSSSARMAVGFQFMVPSFSSRAHVGRVAVGIQATMTSVT
jgi:hypothetical protein